jgi:hypothetical protein
MAQTTLNGSFALIFVISMFGPSSSLLALGTLVLSKSPGAREMCLEPLHCVI